LIENHGGVAGGGCHPGQYPDDKMYMVKSERPLDFFDVAFSTVRHPFDVFVSLYRYRLAKEYYEPTGKPIDYQQLSDTEMRYIIGWVNYWENSGAHVLRYEDLYPDKFGDIIRQAADVLEIETDQSEIDDIVLKFTPENNFEHMQSMDKWFDYTDSMLTLAHIGPNAGKPGEGEKLPRIIKDGIVQYANEFMRRHEYI